MGTNRFSAPVFWKIRGFLLLKSPFFVLFLEFFWWIPLITKPKARLSEVDWCGIQYYLILLSDKLIPSSLSGLSRQNVISKSFLKRIVESFSALWALERIFKCQALSKTKSKPLVTKGSLESLGTFLCHNVSYEVTLITNIAQPYVKLEVSFDLS